MICRHFYSDVNSIYKCIICSTFSTYCPQPKMKVTALHLNLYMLTSIYKVTLQQPRDDQNRDGRTITLFLFYDSIKVALDDAQFKILIFIIVSSAPLWCRVWNRKPSLTEKSDSCHHDTFLFLVYIERKLGCGKLCLWYTPLTLVYTILTLDAPFQQVSAVTSLTSDWLRLRSGSIYNF